MSSSSYHITTLLEKMGDADKDFRYMALTDLMSELQKESLSLDSDTEEKICERLLVLLGDKNGEVQNLAVKCLGPLVGKVKGNRVENIVDVLGNNMLSQSEQLRGISTMGLMMVISELHSSSLAAPVSRRICSKLTTALTYPKLEVQIQLESLDIMSEVLHKFGSLVQSQHDKVQAALLPLLSNNRVAVRKRTSVAIGYLVQNISNTLFEELIKHVMDNLVNPTKFLQSYITCINVISRHAGHRFGNKLKIIVPKVAEFAHSAGENDDLRESAIQVLESCVLWCPGEMQEFTGQIVDISLNYITYDPNYNYDSEDEEDEEYLDDEDDYSDDEDMSWKVRRSCAKCLAAIVQARPELLCEIYTRVSPVLISRFKEREKSVRLDIFNTYSCILRQTASSKHAIVPEDEMQDITPLVQLGTQVDAIVRGLEKQLYDKNDKTRQSCFSLLGELVTVLPGCLTPYIDILLPALHKSLSTKGASCYIKISSLSFLRTLLTHHSPDVFQSSLPDTLSCVIGAVQDTFYKVISEALLVSEQLVFVIRPKNSNNPQVSDLSTAIFNATLYRLKEADLDQEVKERAITCMGHLLANMADLLQSQLAIALPLFLDRLRNEITRLTTVKALSVIAKSSLNVDLQLILGEAFPLLGTFLRKTNRALKLSTLELLDNILIKYSSFITLSMVNDLIDELPRLISESDTHVSQLALMIVSRLSETMPQSMDKIPDGVLPAALTLIRSPLLQGSALTSMTTFFCSLVRSGNSRLTFVELVQHLTNPVYNPSPATQPANSPLSVHKQAFYSTSSCISALALNCATESEYQSVITKLLDNLKSTDMSCSVRLFALLTLGGIGKHRDLSEHKNLQNVIMSSFNSPTEEVKSAASYALGNVSVGNLTLYLPIILTEIQNNSKRQYLLLHAMKEIITSMSEKEESIELLKNYVPDMWNLLIRYMESSEEGSRKMVAACLGKLMLIDHETLLPKLLTYTTSPSAHTRSTVVTAIKYTVKEEPQSIDVMLRQYIGQFLKLLKDQDLHVRRMALVTLNSTAHNKPALIREHMEDILPDLYAETTIKLKREVEMGPFKYPVDDALDNRKAAFECMYTVLQSCIDRVNIFQFLDHIEIGLKDVPDIKMLTYLMVLRLVHINPNAIMLKLESILEPLRDTFQSKLKDICPIGQEVEKVQELKRSAMRAVVALSKIPDIEKHPVFIDFMKKLRANKETDLLLEQELQANQASYDDMVFSVEH